MLGVCFWRRNRPHIHILFLHMHVASPPSPPVVTGVFRVLGVLFLLLLLVCFSSLMLLLLWPPAERRAEKLALQEFSRKLNVNVPHAKVVMLCVHD